MAATLDYPATTNASTGDTDTLNSLLRGEMSAVETYQQGIAKFEDAEIKQTLGRIRDEHSQIVSQLRARVIASGGTPSNSSGPWGTFATTVTGTAKLIGPQTVLVALREGEEHGYNDYEKSVENKDLSMQTRDTFAEYMSKTKEHILTINKLIEDYAAE